MAAAAALLWRRFSLAVLNDYSVPMRSARTAAVAAMLVLAGCGAPAGVALADPAPAPAPGPKTAIDADGTYVVGKDIQPGTYSSAGPVGGGACYWKRSNGTN